MFKNRSLQAVIAIYAGLALLFIAVPYLIFHASNPSKLAVVTFADEVDRYTNKQYPEVFKKIQKEFGAKTSEPTLIPAERNFLANSVLYRFAIDDQTIWLFEFSNANDLKTVKESFYLGGYKYKDARTQKDSFLLFEHEPHFYFKDNFMMVHTGTDQYIEKLLTKIVGEETVITPNSYTH